MIDEEFHGPGGPAYRDSYSPDSRPWRGRWKWRLTRPGEVLEVDVIVVPGEDWPARKEAGDPAWRPINFGESVVALKALC